MAATAQVTTSLASDPRTRRRRRRVAVLAVVVPAVVYFALACLLYYPILPLDTRHVVGPCACGDATQQTWFLDWVAYAVGHGHNPMFSAYLNAPAGANLAVNTSMPLLGLIGWPVTALFNAIAAFNFLLRLGLALSALSMYLVLGHYVRSRGAAFVGGLLFGFSPYMFAEGQLHVFLIVLPLLPPLIPLIDHWLIRADRNPYRCGALVGVIVGLETLVSVELAAVFAIFAVFALAPLVLRYRSEIRSRVALLLRGLVTTVAVGLLIGGYVIWMLIAGPQRPIGPPHSVADLDSYHADALSPFVPGPPQLLRPPVLHGVADHFVKGVVHENGFYLGIPLLIVLLIGAVQMRRHPLVLSLTTLAVLSFIFGLGTHLTIGNHRTAIPMPLAVLTKVPLLQEVGPTRFALSMQLAAAVLLALFLDRVMQRSAMTGLRRPAALVVLSLVTLVPLLPNGFIHSTRAYIPAYFTSEAVTEIPGGSIVLPYPYPFYSANDSMFWQTESGMRFRTPGGEVYVPGPSGRSRNYARGDLPPALWAVLVRAVHWHTPSAAARAARLADLRTYVGSHRIDAIAVRASGAQGRWVAALAASAFGPPTGLHGGVSVWVKPTAP